MTNGSGANPTVSRSRYSPGMHELIGWADLVDFICSIFSKGSRRDYPMIFLVLFCIVGCAAIYFIWFR